MIPWFITKNGRLFTRTVVGIATVGVFGAHIAIHGPLLHKYQEFVQMYSHGSPKRLPWEVLQTADVVLNDFGLDEAQKKKVTLFTVIGQELFHAGATNFFWGAIIGLPFMFGIREKSDIDFHNMKLYGKEDIDWSSAGKQLAESLILSEKAEKFAIARELFACDIKNVFFNAALSSLAIYVPARIVQKSNASGKAFTLSFRKRGMFYALIYVLSFIMCKCIKDPNKHFHNQKCDRKAAELGPDYLEGGIEYFEKTLRKNKALRKLMGSEGERLYDLSGNETYFLFTPHLPVSKRLELLLKMKEKTS